MKNLFFLLAFLPAYAFAQTGFVREYLTGNDSLYHQQGFQSACLLPNGDFLAEGQVQDTNGIYRTDFIRFDSAGTMRWSKFPQLPQNPMIYQVTADSTSCYINGFWGAFFAILVHTDTAVNATWAKHIADTLPGYRTHILYTTPIPGQGVYAYGAINSLSPQTAELWVMRFDTAGNTLWSQKYSIPGYLVQPGANGVLTKDKSIVLPFSARYDDSLNNMYTACGLMQLDSSGNIQWSHCFADSLTGGACAIQLMPDSGFALGGLSATNSPTGEVSPYLLRTDRMGNLLWYRRFDRYSAMGWPTIQQGLALLPNGHLLYSFSNTQGYSWDSGEYVECDTSGQVLASWYLGDSSAVSLSQLVRTPNGRIASIGMKKRVTGNQWYYVPVLASFFSPSDLSCELHTDTLTAVSDTLRTDHPAFVVSAGPVAYPLGTVAMQNFPITKGECLLSATQEPGLPENALTLYPNPSNGEVTIRLDAQHAGEWQLDVYDVHGRLVKEEQQLSGDTYTLQANSFDAGMYFVRVTLPGGAVAHRALVLTQ